MKVELLATAVLVLLALTLAYRGSANSDTHFSALVGPSVTPSSTVVPTATPLGSPTPLAMYRQGAYAWVGPPDVELSEFGVSGMPALIVADAVVSAAPDTTPEPAPAEPTLSIRTNEPEFAMIPASQPPGCPDVTYEALGWAGCAISWCESGWDEDAVGDLHNGRPAYGDFQVVYFWHWPKLVAIYGETSPEMLQRRDVNVRVTQMISGNGEDWGAWPTRSVLFNGVCPNGRGKVPA